jgi:hypothetical protein
MIKTLSYDVGNPGPGLGQAQQCRWVVCCLFEWKRFCAAFYSLFIYVLTLEIQLSRGEGWDPINRFNRAKLFCACPNPRPRFLMLYDRSVITWRSVLLVDETGVPEKTTDLS